MPYSLHVDLRPALIRELDILYLHLWEKHEQEKRVISGRIPVGGAHMDDFFKLEGVRGILHSLREGDDLTTALEKGKDLSRLAVRKWNDQHKKDWQIHRWEETAFDYLDSTVRFLLAYTGE